MPRFSLIVVLSLCAVHLPGGAALAEEKEDAATRTIRVAAVQLRGEKGGIAVNQAKAEKLIREAAGQGAEYILLPELYGLFPVAIWAKTVDEVRQEAQPVPGPLTDFMLGLAKELKVNIGFGMLEKRGDKLFNTAVFVDSNGIAGTYSKRAMVTHEGLRRLAEQRTGKPQPKPKEPLGPDEGELFTKGTNDGVLNWGGVKTGVLICADGGQAGFWKHLQNEGVQLLCWPVANSGGPLLSPPGPKEIVQKYGLPMIFANHLPKQMLHEGNSEILNASGARIGYSHLQPDTVVVGDVTIRE